MTLKLLIHSAKQVVQVCRQQEAFLRADEIKERFTVLQGDDDKGGISVVVDGDGFIVDIGRDGDIEAKYDRRLFDTVIDASGTVVLPGFVDAHTHPVWAGDRVHEFAMKLAGATYLDVHRCGGGINYTVERTRAKSEEELLHSLLRRLEAFMRNGTTTVECKSGYGLDLENEVKLLRVIHQAAKQAPVDLSITYCGAHSVPKGTTSGDATEAIVSEHLPKIEQMCKSGELHVDNVDVFCESGVFDVEQTEKILRKSQECGFLLNFHGEELSLLRSAEMGARLQARAISHLEKVSDEGIAAMAKSNTSAVILPTTAYILRLEEPPVRKMLQQGVIVALGSDFNPNAYCLSMPVVMHLACVLCYMSMEESLVAATLNAAYSLNKSDSHGSIEVGKKADFVIISAPRWEHIIYQFANASNIIKYVIKSGALVHENTQGVIDMF